MAENTARRWFQFRLRALLVVVALVAVAAALVSREMERRRQEQAELEAALLNALRVQSGLNALTRQPGTTTIALGPPLRDEQWEQPHIPHGAPLLWMMPNGCLEVPCSSCSGFDRSFLMDVAPMRAGPGTVSGEINAEAAGR